MKLLPGIGRLSKAFNSIAAAWLIFIALLICADVIGRGVFDQPVQGVSEIVANSIVAILFLQLPLAVFEKSMIRATLVYDLMGFRIRQILDSIVCLAGVALFGAIAYGATPDMILGWQIGETEGAGALAVPVYPTRTIIVVLSAITALLYALLLPDVWRSKRVVGLNQTV